MTTYNGLVENIIWILFKIYLIIQTFKYYCIPEDNKDDDGSNSDNEKIEYEEMEEEIIDETELICRSIVEEIDWKKLQDIAGYHG
ncbi:unnamed protein product [Rhizophagus irregularis]|nr:unnamed protein product [Rhizophagus irregularis]